MNLFKREKKKIDCRKIVDGYEYDTYISEIVAQIRDRQYFTVTLFRSPNGRYFTYYECRHSIWPFTREQAFNWLRNHDFLTILEDEFSDMYQEG